MDGWKLVRFGFGVLVLCAAAGLAIDVVGERLRSQVSKLRRLGLLAIILAFTACASRAPARQPMPETSAPETVAHIAIDSTTEAFLSAYRLRLFDHKTEPDIETVLCLYGIVQNDTAYVGFIRPTLILAATAGWVSYAGCPAIQSGRLGVLRYLGTWHPHFPDSLEKGGCYFSTPDTHSFEASQAVIELVGCRGGIIGRRRGAQRTEQVYGVKFR